MRRMLLALFTGVLCLSVVPTGRAQGDCQALINTFVDTANPASSSQLRTSIATLNNKNVGSWAQAILYYEPARRGPVRPTPARFVTRSAAPGGIDNPYPPARQLFSDRVTGPKFQPFDIDQPDELAVEISVVANPTVTITLRSWGDARANFVPRCDGNFMIGETPDVKYLLFLSK